MRILVAEDDDETATHVARILTARDHQIVHAANGDEAGRKLADERFDLVILDRMMPLADGLAVLARARDAGCTTPVLMLTALGSIADRVEGLETGADDYLVKPFASSELVARVNALGRRRGEQPPAARLTAGNLTIDILAREARCNGKLIALQPRELRLLEEMMRNAGRLVTRAMLLQAVWRLNFEPQTNIVESHMSRLRSKLALAGARNVIETVRGEGYRLRETG